MATEAIGEDQPLSDDDQLAGELAVLLQLQARAEAGLGPVGWPERLARAFTATHDVPRAVLCRDLRAMVGPFASIGDVDSLMSQVSGGGAELRLLGNLASALHELAERHRSAGWVDRARQALAAEASSEPPNKPTRDQIGSEGAPRARGLGGLLQPVLDSQNDISYPCNFCRCFYDAPATLDTLPLCVHCGRFDPRTMAEASKKRRQSAIAADDPAMLRPENQPPNWDTLELSNVGRVCKACFVKPDSSNLSTTLGASALCAHCAVDQALQELPPGDYAPCPRCRKQMHLPADLQFALQAYPRARILWRLPFESARDPQSPEEQSLWNAARESDEFRLCNVCARKIAREPDQPLPFGEGTQTRHWRLEREQGQKAKQEAKLRPEFQPATRPPITVENPSSTVDARAGLRLTGLLPGVDEYNPADYPEYCRFCGHVWQPGAGLQSFGPCFLCLHCAPYDVRTAGAAANQLLDRGISLVTPLHWDSIVRGNKGRTCTDCGVKGNQAVNLSSTLGLEHRCLGCVLNRAQDDARRSSAEPGLMAQDYVQRKTAGSGEASTTGAPRNVVRLAQATAETPSSIAAGGKVSVLPRTRNRQPTWTRAKFNDRAKELLAEQPRLIYIADKEFAGFMPMAPSTYSNCKQRYGDPRRGTST